MNALKKNKSRDMCGSICMKFGKKMAPGVASVAPHVAPYVPSVATHDCIKSTQVPSPIGGWLLDGHRWLVLNSKLLCVTVAIIDRPGMT